MRVGGSGETRANALWGSRGGGLGRRLATSLAVPVLAAALVGAPAASAGGNPGKGAAPGQVKKDMEKAKEHYVSTKTYAPGSLYATAQAKPNQMFDVIVELKGRSKYASVLFRVAELGKLKHQFRSIDGVAVKLPGWAILYIAEHPELFDTLAVTEDVRVRASEFAPLQLWPAAVGADSLWPRDAVDSYLAPKAPAIAVVDSGIEPGRAADFGARVVASVGLSSLSPGETDDDHGHGTFVASIAAGSATQYPGAAPTADIVSLRVMNEGGMALTSDVIAAADWILANKDAYNIRVANFSLHSASANSFKFDPLDHAVERLWLNGVVIVAASGNFGDGAPKGMYYAPGNDPFVITVGAADMHETVEAGDDDVAPWSAFGYTADGFAKPEVVAPGRYMVAAVPAGATLAKERKDKVVSPGYMQLSGTSFAAPIVAGAAAQLLALHPGWTPDQVKGALMSTSRPLALPNTLADGVGEIDLGASASLSSPPSANAPLRRFLTADPAVAGGLVFDAAAWSDAAWSDAAWYDAAWSDAAWSDAAWSDAAWSDASFAAAAWSDASQADAALADAAWSDAAAKE